MDNLVAQDPLALSLILLEHNTVDRRRGGDGDLGCSGAVEHPCSDGRAVAALDPLAKLLV